MILRFLFHKDCIFLCAVRKYRRANCAQVHLYKQPEYEVKLHIQSTDI